MPIQQEVNGAPVPLYNGEPLSVDDDKFNLCSECGDQLTDGEDGFGTTHGTCNTCIWSDE